MIYLASPYSHSDPSVRNQRFKEVCQFAAILMKRGQHVFSLIAHTHSIALYGNLPRGWDYWEELDRFWLGVCEEVVVLCLDGWKQSAGVTAEIKIAKELGKRITYFIPGKDEMLFNSRLARIS